MTRQSQPYCKRTAAIPRHPVNFPRIPSHPLKTRRPRTKSSEASVLHKIYTGAGTGAIELGPIPAFLAAFSGGVTPQPAGHPAQYSVLLVWFHFTISTFLMQWYTI